MTESTHKTKSGEIHYWHHHTDNPKSIVFLPGLTADHRLFDPQIACFRQKYTVLVWDAPGHAASYPFTMDFTLMDKAGWLHEILTKENLHKPILVGQSMGGYVV